MTYIVVKVIIGLFIWMVLPKLIFQKKTRKKAPFKKFTFIVCTIIGIVIIVYGVIDFFKMIIG